MGNTKEEILLVSLHLFAQDGYEAVSVSQIAGELGITKGALYRHYQSKRDIFDHILACMEQGDGEQTESHDMPQERKEDAPETYQELSFVDFMAYSQSMFAYWTEDDFASSFRKMLTLEQFRNAEMQELYQQYLVSGPVAYVKDLFESMKFDSALEKAVQFYATMFFFYSMYDGAEDKEQVKLEFETSLRKIAEELYENEQAVEEKVTERNGK
ncbi:TetR/AcrR family transcriptional regulator [Roseburia sp. BX1005]|uniref:TetR/AcrR family transcriptional regulator n=1 Tax=Roseburia zhanii TaxID=2763064 RepID=A0A923LN69_9FIRM|nr:TetR/AcrR family transcriptional regulator [Roseburia zhanii]MBC5713990.1 TetR/AcrR family transcriptional regulator [Roseburia zhanii]